MDQFERGLVWHFYHTTTFLLMGKKLNRKSSKSQVWNLSVGKKSGIYQCTYICFPMTSRISLITHLTSPAFVSFCIHLFLLSRICTNQTRNKCIVLYIECRKHRFHAAFLSTPLLKISFISSDSLYKYLLLAVFITCSIFILNFNNLMQSLNVKK